MFIKARCLRSNDRPTTAGCSGFDNSVITWYVLEIVSHTAWLTIAIDFAQILIEKIQVQDGTCILHVEDSILTHQYLEEIDLSLLPRHEEIKAIDDTAVKLWNSTTGQRPANMSTQLRCLRKSAM